MFLEAMESRQMFSTVLNSAARTLVVQGTNGNDSIRVGFESWSNRITVQVNNEAAVYSGDAVDHLWVYGLDGKDTIDASAYRKWGYPQSCEFYGGAGNDVIKGSPTVSGLFDGGSGADDIVGSSDTSNDTVTYESRTANLVVDLYNPYRGSGEFGENDSLTGIENCVCGAGNDTVYGSEVANVIRTKAGNDTVFASGGDDLIYGDTGNDIFYGEGGNDSLFGEAGDDYIVAGLGNDQLVGGAGRDLLYARDGVYGNDSVFGDNLDGTGDSRLDTAEIDSMSRTVYIAGKPATMLVCDKTFGVDFIF